MILKTIYLSFLLLLPSLAFPQAEFPPSVPAGSPFELHWKGSETSGRLAVLEKTGMDYNRTGGWRYLNAQSPVIKMSAPLKAGQYYIGLADSGGFAHVQPLTVTPVEAKIEAPDSAEINENIEIRFEGPAYAKAVIGIYEETDRRDIRHSYTYPSNATGGTVSLKTPLDPGNYHIKYLLGDVELATHPIAVGGAEATLDGPDTVQAGAELVIEWTGPVAAGNTIGFVKPGDSRRVGDYRYVETADGQAVRLNTPEQPGQYEVAFFVRSKVIERHGIDVIEATATLDAPEQVTAFERFDVEWTGPGNRSDRIEILTPDGARHTAAYVKKDSRVVSMRAQSAGDFALQYRTRGGRVLAERPFRVVPPPSKPGSVKISAGPGKGLGENTAVEVILDASGSMLTRQGGQTRIGIAKETLVNLLGEAIPAGTPFALRVFGHKEADSCRTDLEIPLGPLDVVSARQRVRAVQAMNRARTPIAASLSKTRSDLEDATGDRIIILLTDGEETCNGDPLQAIDSLMASSDNLRVNIVGYAIDDKDLRETFRSWAALGDGLYLTAPDAEELAAAMRQVLEIPFEVRRDETTVVTGVTGDSEWVLPAGDYQLHYKLNGQLNSKPIRITSERLTQISLP